MSTAASTARPTNEARKATAAAAEVRWVHSCTEGWSMTRTDCATFWLKRDSRQEFSW